MEEKINQVHSETLPEKNEIHSKKGKGIYIWIGIAVIALCTGLTYLMIVSGPDISAKIRDISIVLFVLGSLLIAVTSVILIVQLAILINLVRNEMKPILKTTKETVNNVKGTVEFLSDHMVEPVIKTNSNLAGVAKVVSILSSGLKKRKRR